MTANAAALEIAENGYNLNNVSGALMLACDLIEDLIEGKKLSAAELEFVGHARELAEGVRQ